MTREDLEIIRRIVREELAGVASPIAREVVRLMKAQESAEEDDAFWMTLTPAERKRRAREEMKREDRERKEQEKARQR